VIFPQIRTEKIVQVNDRTRINCIESFVSPDEADITLVEIQPITGGDFIDVTSTLYLDWVYTAAENVTATVRITTDSTPVTATKTFTIISVADDLLFSDDEDILTHESDIYRFLRLGRSSFIDMHRLAQELILEDLAKRNITNWDGTKIEKTNIFDLDEVKEWSKFLTLSLIFKSTENEVNDFFMIKSNDYKKQAEMAANRATIKLDKDVDGVVDSSPDLVSGRLIRR
jgi:hypothetical protein